MSSLAGRGQSLCIDGLPGVGKTSLLLYFFQKQKAEGSGTVPLYLDVQKMSVNSPHEFLADLHYHLLQESGQTDAYLQNLKEELIDGINKSIGKVRLTAGKKIVFIFDNCEANNLLKDENVVSCFQKIKRDHNGRLSFFFAGSTLDSELLKFTGGLNLVLKTFNFYQHQEMLKGLLKNASFAMTEFQTEELFALCGGHPGLTIAVLEIAQRQVKSIRWEEFKKEVGTQPEIKNYHQKIWSTLRKNQKGALRAFVRNDYQKNQEILADLEDLEKKGYFRKNNGRLQLFSKLFENFILKNEEKSVPSGLFIEEKSGRVFNDGREVTALLTSTEFLLLTLLAKSANKVTKREPLLKELARKKGTISVSDEALDQLVVRLRSKIERDRNNPQHLLTLRGRGFQFIP